MNTYEGSIYDPDTLHKYLYANGNPVMYSDPNGNMFDFSSTAMGMGIQNVLNSAVQISYRGVMCGLTNMTLTAVMGGSWEQAKSSFVTGFILGAGISVVRYFVVGAELVTLARFYVLSASANFIFSATMTVFAVTKGYSELAVMTGVMVVLSIAEWCWAYGNYLLIDVYGNNGSATIECNPNDISESGSNFSTANSYGIDIDNLNFSNTVLNHTGRPYQDLKWLINEIIESKPPVPDPHGTNAWSWTVEGSFNGDTGYYELIIDPESNTVWHFVFKSQKK